MRRFFLQEQEVAESTAWIRDDLYHHLAHVLRMRPDDKLILADGKGNEYIATIQAIHSDELTVSLERTGSEKLAPLKITLLQALPKGDKMEMILQKNTELGVTEFVPVAAERSVVKISKEKESAKLARWQKIAAEAARQSLRPDIPTIRPVQSYSEAVNHQADVKLLLWEKEEKRTLKEELGSHERAGTVAIMVGPEGGLSDNEAKLAVDTGFVPVTLGKRILRTETAGLAMVAVLQYVWGDFGS